jgi:Tfp pilus assembly protein PilX
MKIAWLQTDRTLGGRMLAGRQHSGGFTLIASLLMLLLLSGIAIGLLMMANTESKVGGTDLQNNIAYHAAEGGIEKMYSDLSAVFQNSQAPTTSEICNVSNTPPSMIGVSWSTYSVAPGSGCGTSAPTTPTANWKTLSGGPEAGLYAQVIPVNMQATAAMSGGQEVNMMRSAQVALIPVFQYGVFCEGDCAFFDNPNLDFAGRVHANGDLYIGIMAGNTLTFHQKLEAYGNIVTETIPNGLTINAGAGQDTGNVYIPTVSGGCTSTSPLVNCVLKPANSDPATSPFGDGSVQGAGGNPPTSTYNGSNWNTFSNTTTSGMIINGNYGSTTNPGTGAKKLSMPFVGGGVQTYEIIRRPPSGEQSTSAVGTSREYNMAQIHVLLSDDPADLPGGASDSNNVRLANISATQATLQGGSAAATNQWGITIASPNYSTTFGNPTAGNTYNLYFAAASNVVPTASQCTSSASCALDWPYAPAQWTANPSPALEGLQPSSLAPIYLNSGSPTAVGLCPPNVTLSSSVTVPTGCPATPTYPYYAPPNANGSTLYNSATSTAWSLIDGYLRVEYVDKNGVWHPVTNEWLGLGFARGVTPPSAGVPNPITPNAILLLQEAADRDGNGTVTYTNATAPTCSAHTGSGSSQKCTAWTGIIPEVALDTAASAAGITTDWAFGLTPNAPVATPPASATPQSLTQYNWYPINFYDAREGEPRDVIVNNDTCTTNGVMNAVEIDVGNLKKWLAGSTGTSGGSVDYVAQNGYVLYFSDRRGMLLNPNTTSTHPASTKSGDSGLEDVVNASSSVGTPDGALQTPTASSPEDVNLNGALDNFGAQNLGLGFWNDSTHNLNTMIVAASPDNPYGTVAPSARITSCGTTGRKNWVSGARHVLKLVDGALGNVPLSPVTTTVNGVTYNGGFTVSSENPVYIQGDYNSNAGDNFWPNGVQTGVADKTGHSAAAVIADAVTILSNAWSDENSMIQTPTQPSGNRAATTTYYRLAVAGGRNLSFPFPSWANSNPDYPFATDGGVGNFLRMLEDWSGATLNYGGSLVSLYNATYNTGLFKCCTYSVYQPPTRNYIFDSDFTLPEGLPPGTPLFRDVESLSYRQLFNPRTD